MILLIIVQYLMNKGNIKKFIHDFEENFSLQIIEVDEDSSEEFYSSQFFYKYIQVLCNNDMLFESYRELMQLLYIDD